METLVAICCHQGAESQEGGGFARAWIVYPSAEPLLRYLHWLPVAQRIKYKIAMLMHRALTTGQPPYLSELLQCRTSLRTTRSTNMELLSVPVFRLELLRKAFRFAAPTVWNTLPIELRRRLSPSVFKTGLKTFLFNAAYSN